MKIVIRENLPETNSSSSHSIVINSRKIDYSLPAPINGKIQLNLDGYDEYSCFGRQWQRTRNTIGKLTYIISAFCTDGAGGKYGGLNSKKLIVLSNIVKEITGYPLDVEDILTHRGVIPSIDHQENGNELFTNNKDVLKNFIFNKNSILLLGSDEGYNPDNYFKLGDESDYSIASAVYSIDFKGDVGEIDFIIKDYPMPQRRTILDMIVSDSVNRDLIQSIGYDTVAKKTRFLNMKDAIDNKESYCFESDTLILPDIWGSMSESENNPGESRIIFGNKNKDFVKFFTKFKKILWKNQ